MPLYGRAWPNWKKCWQTGPPARGGKLPESDITDRKRIENALKASEVRYRRLFETAKDGILILDADTGRITDANPFLKDLLGYSHSELLGKKLWEIGPFRDIAASRAAAPLRKRSSSSLSRPGRITFRKGLGPGRIGSRLDPAGLHRLDGFGLHDVGGDGGAFPA